MEIKLKSTKEQWDYFRETPFVFLFIQSLFALLLGGIPLLFASASYPHLSISDLLFKYMDPLVCLLNIIPPMLLFASMVFLLRKPAIAYLIQSVLTFLLCIINYYKIELRNEPFLFYDYKLLFEATNMMGSYSYRLSLAVILLTVTLIGTTALEFYLFPPLGSSSPFQFKTSLKIGAVCCLVFYLFLKFAVYSDSFYRKTANYDNINRLSYAQVYLSRGLWYPFLQSSKNTDSTTGLDELPEAYLILDDYQPVEGEGIPLGDISVVAIMLEGFCDYSDFPALSQEEGVLEVYETWHRLQAEGVSGNIINTVFGGGTAYTERCFLTGIPGADDDFKQNTNSYVWMFRNAGYFTHGAHIGFQDFYNRKEVNEYLGFQSYYFYEDLYSHLIDEVGLYTSDDIFFDSIMKQLDDTRILDKPTFSFFVTFQNHGPYEQALDMSNSYLSTTTGLSTENRARMQTYLEGIENTLYHITRLEEYLNNRDEPFMMVLFGDHMPWAGTNNSMLTEINANLDISTVQGMLDYFGTPYLIWANDAAKEVITGDYPAEGGDFSNHFLMNKLFDTVGWEKPAEIGYSSYVMSQLPVFFRTWEYAYWYNGQVVVELPDHLQSIADGYISYSYCRRLLPYAQYYS